MGRLMRRRMSGSAGVGEDGGAETTASRLVARTVADEGPVIAAMSPAEAKAELADVEVALGNAATAYADAVARAALVRARLLEIENNGEG
jgi:hypothetical protein